MLPILHVSLALLATSVVARPYGTVISTDMERDTQASPSTDCNVTCAAFAAASIACKTPHCGCNNEYFQTQGDCLVCQTTNPQGAASVQYFLDVERNQCHSEGIDVDFKLQLSPDAQAIVDDFDRKSARLRVQQTAFLALQITGGHVGLVILLVFAISSRKVHRDPTFLNFCITWIFSSVVYSLMLYRGTQGNTLANSLGRVAPNRCLAQAALVNGAQVMTACSTMALVIQLCIGLRAAIYGDLSYGPKQKQWTTIGLVVFPYVCFIAFALPSIFVGTKHIVIQDSSLERALPANFYCSIIELRPLLRAVYGATLALLIIAAVFDAFIITALYRHWWAVRKVHVMSSISLPTLLRVVIFSVYRIIVAVTYGAILNMPPHVVQSISKDALSISYAVPVWFDMLQAAIPLVGFLVLGVSGDMLSTLFFCRRNKRSMSTAPTFNITNESGGVDIT